MDLTKVSVVIPTLGGDSLEGVIKKLNEGSNIPDEILICIPRDVLVYPCKWLYKNVKIISTDQRGQVFQRSVGFKNAKNDLVLQIDDDIEVDKYCLENLIRTTYKYKNASVGPKLYDIKSKKYASYLIPDKNKHILWQKLIYFLINGKKGFQQGKISLCGVNMGVEELTFGPLAVDWLPGGCVLHWRKNLVLYDFYPNRGKAFAEDLFHSRILLSNGVSLIRCNNSVAYVDFQSGKKLDSIQFIKSYIKYSSILNLFATSFVNKIRLNIFLALNFVKIILTTLIKKI